MALEGGRHRFASINYFDEGISLEECCTWISLVFFLEFSLFKFSPVEIRFISIIDDLFDDYLRRIFEVFGKTFQYNEIEL